MAYVPGFHTDIFVSYAHGDDREWIAKMIDRFETEVQRRLGMPIALWLDEDDLRRTRDFTKEIPEVVRSSAVFVLLVSPRYLRSTYCIEEECRAFAETIPVKRASLGATFANDLFAVRCLLLRVDNNEHYELFAGATDIAFCDIGPPFRQRTEKFDTSLRRLVDEVADLLKRMRNQRTAVFLYPWRAAPEIAAVHSALASELGARSYRVLPDRMVNLGEQLRAAAVSVFLLGANFDDGAEVLTEVAADSGKPWVVWRAPAIARTAPEQLGFGASLEAKESHHKVFLSSTMPPAKIKEEVLALLRPGAMPDATTGKPRVYLVYNSRDLTESTNAGLISYAFRKEVHFDHPDDPAQHTIRLSRSDGVLLVWATADEDWCAREFAQIVQVAGRMRGVCVFDPRESKTAAIAAIRRARADVYVGEQFGRFNPARLQPFFASLRRPKGVE